MAPNNDCLVSAIRVVGLFGLYTYNLPQDGVLPNAAILYGDNGVGKSTILRLAFHLLSPAGKKSHRTALLKTKFSSFEIDLSTGITLRAHREKKDDVDVVTMTVLKDAKALAIWTHREGHSEDSTLSDDYIVELIKNASGETRHKLVKKPPSKANRQDIPTGEKAFLSVLETYAPRTFILNAERRLDSDSIADPSDEVELRRAMHFEDTKRIRDVVVRSREIALTQAMSNAARWVQSKAVRGANQGSMNVHSVYTNVLQHLAMPSRARAKPISQTEASDLAARLLSIEARTADLARYELTTPLQTADFRASLQVKLHSKRVIAVNVIRPYVDSLEGRLKALAPVYDLVDRFIRTLNSFLIDKTVSFKLSEGFSIVSKLGAKLDSSQLSSGEQQLLLLFCYVLTARDQPSLFMIDEPEISLNVKWQRQLVQSLLDVTTGAKTQFIFASHSLELLSQHSDRVVTLENET